VTLRFMNGTIAHVEGSWAHERFVMKFELAGEKGIIEYDSSRDHPITLTNRANEIGKSGVSVPSNPLKEGEYYRELAHFIDCIRIGTKPIVTAEDGYEAMRIALSAIESSRLGEPVFLSRNGEGEQR